MKINLWARSALALVLFYHGLVPKILFPGEVEMMLVKLHNLPFNAALISQMGGVIEIILASILIFLRRSLIPVYLTAILLLVLLIDVAVMKPELLTEAFNPVSINAASLALCWIVVISQRVKNNE